MSITITVPNDDHVALRAMAKALEEIAVARGAASLNDGFTSDESVQQRLKQATEDLMQAAPAMLRINDVDGSVEIHGKLKVVEPDTTSQQVESLVGTDKRFTEEATFAEIADSAPATDSTGTPWDERIHSASKALNSDGTWRVRRKPKDMDEAEWATQVETVKEELNRLCKDEGCDHHGTPHECISVKTDIESLDIQQEIDNSADAAEPPVTPAGDDFHVDAGVVTEQEIAAIPAPPPPPVFATVQEVDEMLGLEPDYTFPQVMQFLTERHGRITSPEVDQIIADMGLVSIMDLNTQPEHTGPFIARVKAHLGE